MRVSLTLASTIAFCGVALAQPAYQDVIDVVPFGGGNETRDVESWSPQQREVYEIVKRIDQMQPNTKLRTDLIVKFGRNGIDIVQEYR